MPPRRSSRRSRRSASRNSSVGPSNGDSGARRSGRVSATDSMSEQSSDEAQHSFTNKRPSAAAHDASFDDNDMDDAFPDGASDEPRPRRSSRAVIDSTELAVRRTRNRTYDDNAKGRRGRNAKETRSATRGKRGRSAGRGRMLSRAKQRKLIKSPGATYVGFSVLFDISKEPVLQYSLGQVNDQGVDVSLWTSYRLKSSTIMVETDAERFEISRDGTDGLGYDTYRFARVKCPMDLDRAKVRSLGVPLPLEHLEVIGSGLDWSCFRWRDDGLRVSPMSPHKAQGARKPLKSTPVGTATPRAGAFWAPSKKDPKKESSVFRAVAPDCDWGSVAKLPVFDLSLVPTHAQIFLPPGGTPHTFTSLSAPPDSASWAPFMPASVPPQAPSPPKRGGRGRKQQQAQPQVVKPDPPAWVKPVTTPAPTGSVAHLLPPEDDEATLRSTPDTEEAPPGEFVAKAFRDHPKLPAGAYAGIVAASSAATLCAQAAEVAGLRSSAAMAPSKSKASKAVSQPSPEVTEDELYQEAIKHDPRLLRKPLLEPDGSLFLPLRTIRYLNNAPPFVPLPPSQASAAIEAFKNELDSALNAYRQRRGALPSEIVGYPVPSSLRS